MDQVNHCVKCGSNRFIDKVRLMDQDGTYGEDDLAVTVYRKPDAMVFKGAVSHPVRPRVCGECGYLELYVEDPVGLLAESET